MSIPYHPIPVAGAEFTSKSRTGGSVPATFDVFLYKPTVAMSELKLLIKLKIHMRPLPPRAIPLVFDANDKPFFTSPWTGTDWQRFIQGATAQADMWNNKFWLIPPASFTEYDLSVHGASANQVWRPNIRCALEVDWDADDAHRTIDVANLNMSFLTPSQKSPGTFRSHALLYDSLDTVPWLFPTGTGPDRPARHFVIAHEIGHAIGLDHIGTLRKTPLCQHAVVMQALRLKPGNSDLKGGSNARVCYGVGQGIALAGNIMGAGEDFTVENANPWVWGMVYLRQRSELWRAVTANPGPGSWVRK